MDGNHRVAKTVQFVLRFAFGRFDHERAGDGPGERGRVKAVIHQALRDVLGGDAVERAQVEDAFVRDEAVAVEIFFEPSRACGIIRVEDGELRRPALRDGKTSKCFRLNQSQCAQPLARK